MGAGLCSPQPRPDDGANHRGGADSAKFALQRRHSGDQLPSQLCRARTHYGQDVLMTVRVRCGRAKAIWNYSGQHGSAFVYRPWQGQSGELLQLQPRSGPGDVPYEAKRRFTVEDHRRMTEGVECRKDEDVIDELRPPISRSKRSWRRRRTWWRSFIRFARWSV